MYTYETFCADALRTVASGYIQNNRVTGVFSFPGAPQAYLVAATTLRSDGRYRVYFLGARDMEWVYLEDFDLPAQALAYVQTSNLTAGMTRQIA